MEAAPGREHLSLLICTSGRPHLLDRCLSALEAGSDLPDQLVLVNGADGQTPEFVARHAAAFPEVVLIVHPNRNLATLRNLGLPYLTGDLIALTDDDAVPQAGWIEAVRRGHREQPQAGGIGGAVRGIHDTFLDRIAERVVFPDPSPRRPIHTLPTVNMSYKREVMARVGEFDETLFRGEDVDYNWRIVEMGRPIEFEPAMSVRHENRQTLAGLYRQQYMYGRAYVRVRHKWPAMYSVYPHAFRSARSWGKLVHLVLAIFYQPLLIARTMPSPRKRLLGYPVLVVHHLVWKLGMLREALTIGLGGRTPRAEKLTPRVTRWRAGTRVASDSLSSSPAVRA